VSQIITTILDLEQKIKVDQANLYALRDKLRNELNKFNSTLFDTESVDRPRITIKVPDGSVYRITLNGRQHGLLIDEVPIVEVA
jgi:hypothetical protein